MNLLRVISALRCLSASLIEGKNKGKNRSIAPQRHEVLITNIARAEFDKLYSERKDSNSLRMMDKVKTSTLSILKSEMHEGSLNGMEIRRDSSGNTNAKGMMEIRTPTSLQIRGFIKHFSSGSTTYWVVLGFVRKKKDAVDQSTLSQMNARFNAIDQSNPLSSNCSIWG